jgi:hypothetical protein
MFGWGASLHASNQNSPEIFQLVKKGKWLKKPVKSSLCPIKRGDSSGSRLALQTKKPQRPGAAAIDIFRMARLTRTC